MSLLERLFAGRKSSADPKQRPSHEHLGALIDAGRYAEALRAIDAALAADPGDPEWPFLRGSLLFTWGRTWEARSFLASAGQRGLRKPGLDLQLAWIELRDGRLDEAEHRARAALEQDQGGWQAHFALASVLRSRGRVDEAQSYYEHALRLSPGNVDCMLSLVACAVAARAFDRAEARARECMSQHPDSDAARAALGAVMIWQERFDAARDTLAQSRTPLPDTGIALRDGGRVEEAVAFYRRLLAESADVNAHAHYAYSLLKAGRLAEGFEQNEFRWMIEPLRSIGARPAGPVWDGQDLHGRTMLLTTEQGVGDVVQFIRFAPLVQRLGATVMVSLRKPMREIVEGMEGVDAVYRHGEAIPHADFRMPLMSLPRAFGTTLDTIPARVPYIPLQADRVDRWRRELAAEPRLKVGVVWSGDPVGLRNPYKSIPLHVLARLGNVRGVRFYSLQKGEAAAQAASVQDAMDLVDLSPRIRDFADTAAIIASLDLVVSICTSVAHLSGALGKPTWTLLSEPADWRWLEHREDTPWYPTMRLFRQPRQGDWAGVVDAVGRALAEVVENPERLRAEPVRQPAAVTASQEQSPGGPSWHVSSQHEPSLRGPSAGDSSLPEPCRAISTRFGIVQVRPNGSRRVRSLIWCGEYARSQIEWLAARIEPGSVVVDVGSGFGAHVAPLASAVGETGQLFLLESRPPLLALLANNLAANAVRSVTTIATAVRGAPSGASDAANPGERTAPVPLDDLGLPPFRWLRIDEDAAALEVLEGAASSLWTFRPGILVATRREDELAPIEECVRDFGYHSARIDSPLCDEHNFNRRTNDIFDGERMHGLIAVPEESASSLPEAKPAQSTAR